MNSQLGDHRSALGTDPQPSESTLLPMLIAGLVLIVLGAVAVMYFV